MTVPVSSWKKHAMLNRTSIMLLIISLLMIRASYWQWQRYNSKLKLKRSLTENLSLPPVPLQKLYVKDPQMRHSEFRKVILEGYYDHNNELLIANRRHNDIPGVFIAAPFKIAGTDLRVLVKAGFIPLTLSSKEKREVFKVRGRVHLTALVRAPEKRKFLAPADKIFSSEGSSWIRMNVEQIAKELPYPVLPVYLEALPDNPPLSNEDIMKQILVSRAGKEELFFLPSKLKEMRGLPPEQTDIWPAPAFETIVPPDRHLGYVYEWAMMAAGSFLAAAILALRRRSGFRDQSKDLKAAANPN